MKFTSTAWMGPTSFFNCWVRLNTLLDGAGLCGVMLDHV